MLPSLRSRFVAGPPCCPTTRCPMTRTSKEGSPMALYAFDGTGNEDREDDAFDSNVSNFFHGYDDSLRNDDPSRERGSLYLKGIGQRARTVVGDKLAEAVGIGGHERVRQALDR